MKAILVTLVFGLSAQGALAADNISEACATSALNMAYATFAQDAGISVDKVDDMANVEEPYIEDGDSQDEISVNVNSRDVRDWDGYARYRVSVRQNGRKCTAYKIVMVSSEGI